MPKLKKCCTFVANINHHPQMQPMPPHTSMPIVRFAIIDPNMLTCLGLQQVLSEMLPMAEVVVYNSFAELQSHADEPFIHYFVSSRIYFEHTAFFRQRQAKSIVLVAGDMMINGVFTLNVCQSIPLLIRDIMSLRSKGHQQHHSGITPSPTEQQPPSLLSSREVEVAVLLCKGYINKEIADRLNISLTTVITHRKNIMDKLRARSLADIIIYCVMNGIVNVEEM